MIANKNKFGLSGTGSIKRNFLFIIVLTVVLAAVGVVGLINVSNNYDNLIDTTLEILDEEKVVEINYYYLETL